MVTSAKPLKSRWLISANVFTAYYQQCVNWEAFAACVPRHAGLQTLQRTHAAHIRCKSLQEDICHFLRLKWARFHCVVMLADGNVWNSFIWKTEPEVVVFPVRGWTAWCMLTSPHCTKYPSFVRITSWDVRHISLCVWVWTGILQSLFGVVFLKSKYSYNIVASRGSWIDV